MTLYLVIHSKIAGCLCLTLGQNFWYNVSNYRIKMDDLIFHQSSDALHYLEKKIPPELRLLSAGVVCGSGLGGLAKSVMPLPRLEVDYKDIPHFPPSKGTQNKYMLVHVNSLTRHSAWPRRKTLIWVARCIQSPDCSYAGKSPVSQIITLSKSRGSDFISKVITKAIQSRILLSLSVYLSDWESTQLSVLYNISYLLDNLVD